MKVICKECNKKFKFTYIKKHEQTKKHKENVKNNRKANLKDTRLCELCVII